MVAAVLKDAEGVAMSMQHKESDRMTIGKVRINARDTASFDVEEGTRTWSASCLGRSATVEPYWQVFHGFAYQWQSMYPS